MAGPISLKLSGVHEERWETVLGQKKIRFHHFEKILEKKITNFFACNLTLPHLCTRDDSLSFEDCRLATHLLNCEEKEGYYTVFFGMPRLL